MQPLSVSFLRPLVLCFCYTVFLCLVALHTAQAQGGYYTGPIYSCSGGATTGRGTLSPYAVYSVYTTGGYSTLCYDCNFANDLFSDHLQLPGAINGKIEAQFIWHGGINNATPPTQVIVTQDSVAAWSYSFFGVKRVGGLCDDGLGDPTLEGGDGFFVDGGISSGTHKSIVAPDSNGNVEVYCTPTASVPGQLPDSGCQTSYNAAILYNSASVSISATNPINPTPIIPILNELAPGTYLPILLSVTYTANVNTFAGLPVPLPLTVTPTIYDSAQNLVTVLPSQPITFAANTSGYATGRLSFTWDGTKADGTVAPPGEYLFEYTVTDSNGKVVDTDKSSFLSITSPAANAVLVSDDGAKATYQVSYGLSSTDTPARSAAAGEVDVYDPNGNPVVTLGNPVVTLAYPLQASDLTPGQHTLSISIPSPTIDGKYTFLVSAQDNDADNDIAGRRRWALQHNQKGPGLPPIVYIKSGTFHVAWCRGGKNVDLTTQNIAEAARKPHFVTNLVQQGVTLPNTVTAASNGSLYSYRDKLIPVGGIGVGSAGSWYGVHEYAERQLYSFGMTEQGGGFGSAPMKLVIIGKGINRRLRYTVADSIQQAYPYGFGCVGLLVNNGAPVGYDDFNHQWNTKQLSPTAQEPRTALGWTANHDFFIVTCNGIHNTPEGFQGKTWDDVKNFFVNELPQLIQLQYNKKISILGAVMLDGGGSTMFAYRNINQNGGNIQTDQGAPQGYSTPPQIITDYVLAVGDTSK